MPGGVNSPVRAFKSVGGAPRFIDRGEGAYLYDVDGNRYLDFCNSWGPLILGHANPEVIAAVMAQLPRGMSYGAATELECQLAEFIVNAVEPVESIRFVSSGTEAVMSALRVARGFTKRDLILKFEGCYHGHADHLLVQAGSGLATFGQPSSAGVPESFAKQTAVLPLADETKLREFFDKHGDTLAAAIIEGIPANNGLLLQEPGYLRLLRSLTEKHGALLVLDEVITGFRIGLGGAAAYYDIRPDLLTYGKVIGGGMPVGAFGGRKDIMAVLSPDGPVYQAGTLSGNPIAMTAGLAALKQVAGDHFFDNLQAKTNDFVGRLVAKTSGRSISVVHIGSIFWIALQRPAPSAAHEVEADGIAEYNRRHRSFLDAGIYMPPSGYEVGFVSMAHTPEMLSGAADILGEVLCGD
jgi:glutamate-1-semialdehyde 2,1-aminomutase